MLSISRIPRNKLHTLMIFIILCYALLIKHRLGYISVVTFVSSIVYILEFQKNTIDKNATLIFCYSISYTFFSYFNGFTYDASAIALYLFAPTAFYIIGKRITNHSETTFQLSFMWLIIIIMYTADIFRAILVSILMKGELVNSSRLLYLEASSNSFLLSATQAGLSICVGLVGLPMFLIETKKPVKYLYLTVFFLSILSTVHLVNRTGLILTIANLVFLLSLYFRKKIVYFIFLLGLIFVSLIILINQTTLFSEISKSYNARGQEKNIMGGRSDRWLNALDQLLSSPFGWASDGISYNVHNMWLDIARNAGWIPCSIILYFSCSTIIKSFLLAKHNYSPIYYLLLGLSITLFLAYFVEPVSGGTFLMMYCLLWGTINELYRSSKKLPNKNTIVIER